MASEMMVQLAGAGALASLMAAECASWRNTGRAARSAEPAAVSAAPAEAPSVAQKPREPGLERGRYTRFAFPDHERAPASL